MPQRKKYTWEFWAIPKIAMNDRELSMDEVFLLGILVTMMNGDNVAWPSQKVIAETLNRSIRSVRTYSEHLEERGWLTIHRGTGNRVESYEVNIPPDPAKSAGSPCKPEHPTLQTEVKNATSSIRKEQIKEHIATNVAGDGFKDHAEAVQYLDQILKDPKTQPHIYVIALYVATRGIDPGQAFDIRSKKDFSAIVMRHSRAAAALVKTYDMDRIEEMIQIMSEYATFDWTLETLQKYIQYTPEKARESLASMKKKVYA